MRLVLMHSIVPTTGEAVTVVVSVSTKNRIAGPYLFGGEPRSCCR